MQGVYFRPRTIKPIFLMTAERYRFAVASARRCDGCVGRLIERQPGQSGKLVSEYAGVVEYLQVFCHVVFSCCRWRIVAYSKRTTYEQDLFELLSANES